MTETVRQPWRRRTTYDNQYPWLLYRYSLPDVVAWCLGVARIRVECMICGKQEGRWLRLWITRPEVGQRIRRQIIEQHEHREMRWAPYAWERPHANHLAWFRWRERQKRLGVYGSGSRG